MRKGALFFLTIILLLSLTLSSTSAKGRASGCITCEQSHPDIGGRGTSYLFFSINEVVTDPETVRPGDKEVELGLWIQNTKDTEIQWARVYLVPKYPLKISKNGWKVVNFGKRGHYGEMRANFLVDINKSAESKKYDFDLEIHYLESREVEDGTEEETHYIYWKDAFSISLEGAPRVELYSPKKVVGVGEDFQLEITVKNAGSKRVRDVDLTLQTPEEIGLWGSASNKYIGVLDPGEEKVVSFSMKTDENIEVGDYPINAILSYEGNSEEIHEFLINVKAEPKIRVVKVYTKPEEFYKGDENIDVNVIIENIGDEEAKSVVVRLLLKPPFTAAYTGSDIGYLEVLKPDQSAELTLSVDVEENIKAGNYQFPLEISYRGSEEEKTNDDIVLKVEPQADWQVGEPKINKESVHPGDTVIFSIPIKNIGTLEAESVKVAIQTKSYFTGAKTDYLGDIPAGEFRIASFELDIDRDTPLTNYMNDLKIIWSKGDERLEQTHSFGINVIKNQDQSARIFIILFGIVGLVVLLGLTVFGLRFRRERELE